MAAFYKSFENFALMLFYFAFNLNADKIFLRSINLASAQPIPVTARWCAPHDQYLQCLNLVNSSLGDAYRGRIIVGDDQQSNTGKSYSVELACIYANHIYECVDLIAKKKADIARFSAEQLYSLTTSDSMAHKSVIMLAVGATSVDSYAREYSTVVVTKVSNIKNIEQMKDRKACFGNVTHVHSPGYTASWIMPIYNAQSKLFRRVSPQNCTTDLHIANQAFGSGACAPGFWATDEIYAPQYTTRLCASCAGGGSSCTPNVTENDPLACLSSGRGDIAFISSLHIQKDFLGSTPKYNKNDYGLICQQDKSDFDVADFDKCNFGSIPNDGYIGLPDSQGPSSSVFGKYIGQLYHAALSNHYPSASFIADKHVMIVKSMNDVMPNYFTYVSPKDYVEQFGNNTFYSAMQNSFPSCNQDVLRLCVDSVEEAEKCDDMQLAFKSAGLPTVLKCLVGYSEDFCVQALNRSTADVTMISSHRADEYVQQQTVRPILTEVYANYDYAIAVTSAIGKRLLDITTSTYGVCSSGADSYAGWEAPNMVLQQLSVIPRTCQLTESWNSLLTQYGSCIPGINNASATLGRGADFPLTTNVAVNLCRACGNSGSGTCKTPPEAPDTYHQLYDTYYGDVGALRCVSRRNGNLAFIRSSAISTINILKLLGDPDFVKDTSSWSLLCSDGVSTKPFSLANVNSCNLGRVPVKWMVARNTDNHQLMRWQDNMMFAFGRARSDYNWLHTYIPYNLNYSSHLLDLIFSNNTRRLSRLDFKGTSLQQFHNLAYSDANKTPFVCRGSSSALSISLYLWTVYSLICFKSILLVV